VTEARTLLGPKFTKESLGHEPDGLIFQPSREVSRYLGTVFLAGNFNGLKRVIDLKFHWGLKSCPNLAGDARKIK
jgi:hypothetical protein